MEERLLNGQREGNDIDQIDTHNLKLDKFSSYQTNHLIYYTHIHVQCSRSQSEQF